MHRNPVTLEFDGTDYEIVPDFKVLAAIEETGARPLALLQEINQMQARVIDLATVIAAVLRTQGKPMTRNECGQRILDRQHGYAKAGVFVSVIITSAMMAGPEHAVDAGEGGDSGKTTGSA